jgi:hypothetical protein
VNSLGGIPGTSVDAPPAPHDLYEPAPLLPLDDKFPQTA